MIWIKDFLEFKKAIFYLNVLKKNLLYLLLSGKDAIALYLSSLLVKMLKARHVLSASYELMLESYSKI